MWYRLIILADIVDMETYLESFPDLEGNHCCVWSRKEREIILSKLAHRWKFYKKALATINKICNIDLSGSARHNIHIKWDSNSDVYNTWRSIGKTEIELISYSHAEHELGQILKELR